MLAMFEGFLALIYRPVLYTFKERQLVWSYSVIKIDRAVNPFMSVQNFHNSQTRHQQLIHTESIQSSFHMRGKNYYLIFPGAY
jgi:hypothetical protein